MIFTWIRYGKPDVSMCLNASLAGLVAITAPVSYTHLMIQQLLDPKQNKFTVNGEQIDMQFYFVAAPDSNMSNNWNILKDYFPQPLNKKTRLPASSKYWM